MEYLKAYIDHFVGMDETAWEELSAYLTPVRYEKGQHIYQKGEVSESLHFITEGIVRSYKLEEDGRDFTWTFHCLNMDVLEHRMLMDIVVVDYVSFTQNVPETLAFEALTDVTLLRISKKDLYGLYEKDPKWQRFATKMAEEAYAAIRQRTFDLLTKNAKERLESLLSYFPTLFTKEVPIAHIASYLGITRQTLARLRREREGKM